MKRFGKDDAWTVLRCLTFYLLYIHAAKTCGEGFVCVTVNVRYSLACG